MNQVLKNEYDRRRAELNVMLEDCNRMRKEKTRTVKFETFDRFC